MSSEPESFEGLCECWEGLISVKDDVSYNDYNCAFQDLCNRSTGLNDEQETQVLGYIMEGFDC